MVQVKNRFEILRIKSSSGNHINNLIKKNRKTAENLTINKNNKMFENLNTILNFFILLNFKYFFYFIY